MSSKPARPVIEKFSPVTGQKLGEFHITTPQEVDEAVARARAAFPAWRALSVEERLEHVQRISDIVQSDVEYFTDKICEDTGKPRFEAITTELLLIPLFVDHYRKEAPRILGRRKVKTPIVLPGKKSYIEHFPMGVIGVISPWNYPLQLAMIPAISALIAGNTVVVKPSEVTPIVGEAMAEIFERAQLPDGVAQIIQGDGSTGAALVEADIDKIFFTGSVSTGRKVMAEAAKKPIPVELELGGKDAFVVCHDANLDRAARAAVWGALVNNGQTCVSVERLLVVDAVYDQFVEKLQKQLERVQIGAPDEDADVGPMIFPQQLDVVEKHIEQAVEAGARVVTGGQRCDREGDFFPPTLLVDVDPEMEVYLEESFGPVLPVIRVRDEDEAIRLANAHQYGLTGSVWTKDVSRGMELASRMECGQVTINEVLVGVGTPTLPFGGIKNSGIGRYHGEEGLLGFTHQKGVLVDRGWFDFEPFWFPYRGKYPELLNVFRGLFSGNLPKVAISFLKLRKMTE